MASANPQYNPRYSAERVHFDTSSSVKVDIPLNRRDKKSFKKISTLVDEVLLFQSNRSTETSIYPKAVALYPGTAHQRAETEPNENLADYYKQALDYYRVLLPDLDSRHLMMDFNSENGIVQDFSIAISNPDRSDARLIMGSLPSGEDFAPAEFNISRISKDSPDTDKAQRLDLNSVENILDALILSTKDFSYLPSTLNTKLLLLADLIPRKFIVKDSRFDTKENSTTTTGTIALGNRSLRLLAINDGKIKESDTQLGFSIVYERNTKANYNDGASLTEQFQLDHSPGNKGKPYVASFSAKIDDPNKSIVREVRDTELDSSLYDNAHAPRLLREIAYALAKLLSEDDQSS